MPARAPRGTEERLAVCVGLERPPLKHIGRRRPRADLDDKRAALRLARITPNPIPKTAGPIGIGCPWRVTLDPRIQRTVAAVQSKNRAYPATARCSPRNSRRLARSDGDRSPPLNLASSNAAREFEVERDGSGSADTRGTGKVNMCPHGNLLLPIARRRSSLAFPMLLLVPRGGFSRSVGSCAGPTSPACFASAKVICGEGTGRRPGTTHRRSRQGPRCSYRPKPHPSPYRSTTRRQPD